MNNTKWRECISLLASHCVYLQLRLVGEADFPLDYEVSNEVISQIQADISNTGERLRICKTGD